MNWSQADLASRANLSESTIRNFEKDRATPSVNNLAAIQRALEAVGVAFIPENGGGPGVRLKKAGQRSDDHPKPFGPATDAVEAMDKAIEGDRKRPDKERLASVKETGEEIPQEEWKRFDAADKKPKR